MKKVISIVALSMLASQSAMAQMYVSGAVNHFNNRVAAQGSVSADTNKVGLQSLGLSAAFGYMGMYDKMIGGGELEVGYDMGTVKSAGTTKVVKSPLRINLVGKLGGMVNAETGLYGILGLGMQKVSFELAGKKLNQVDLVVGAGMSTKISSELALFLEYAYNRPIKTGKINELKFWNETQTFKVGARFFF
jgi:opacity protein-like surface antigen